ncbi:TetR/AcrR family transcriptional regulator [Motilibacter aurantiacus]|uniref:TetR/AcrR family transcriptional regulator n=1 Tax=Motilibacter aurantiacus TaxID=2714955 RepID=UPI00140CFEFA|nr:TetR/AcrR family transcriptional regulator [Motilibacter aurantiacus]NHC45701.1 TetR/AcrR family transcriptional regulator [Motilibacter aurantiacus]
MPENARRPLRADAQRNRDKLLTAALSAFAGPAGADASLESVAKQAGVGIGTLYRHFPTREALVEAVYRTEVERLCDAAPELLAAHAPDAALRRWMDGFVDYMTTKRGMAEALRAVIASGGDPFAETRGRLLDALRSLLDAAAGVQAIRDDVDVQDVLRGLSGVSLAAPDDREQAGRLLDLLMDGLRYRRA